MMGVAALMIANAFMIWFFYIHLSSEIKENSQKTDRLHAVFTEILNKKR